MKSNKRIVYPSWGLSYLTKTPLDNLIDRLSNKDIIQFRVASQPNSNPHLGTITTIFTTFALASYSKTYLNKDSYILFESLTNSPDYTTKRETNNNISYKNLEYSANLEKFDYLLELTSNLSGVKYIKQTYHDFIKDKNIRKYLLEIIQKNDLLDLIQPGKNPNYTLKSENPKCWHIRVPCPICNFSPKNYKDIKLEISPENLKIESLCYEHGGHSINFNIDNETFLEVNTQLRTILKGKLTAEIENSTHILPVWVDGSDWSGEWAIRIFAESLNKIGINKLPRRLFTPCILDWSGAKFSKSLYINNSEYLDQYKDFLNMDNLLNKYGEDKLKELYDECLSWVKESSKFYRNYSIDYFKYKLNL
jgi:hypothetical protein